MISELFFDVETKKLFNEIDTTDPADLGVSIVSVYTRTIDEMTMREATGTMQSFWEKDFPDMWPLFKNAKRIIGFNTLRFDIPALRPYTQEDLTKLPHLDIMQKVREVLGRNLGLNALAKDTLGKQKIDDGIHAVDYWNSQLPENLDKLKMYCEEDVRLTCQLYDFVLHNKYALYTDKWNTKRQLPMDFSYPKDVIDSSRQIGLF